VSNLLEIINPIKREEFLRIWLEEEKTRKIYDLDTFVRIEELTNYPGELKCYLAALTFDGLQNIIVRPNRTISPTGGASLKSIMQVVNAPDFSDVEVKKRLGEIKDGLDNALKVSSLIDSDYVLGRVFCPRQLAVISTPNHFNDFGSDKLYAVNFHRFVGYGQWVAEHGFQPSKVYYCEGDDWSENLVQTP